MKTTAFAGRSSTSSCILPYVLALTAVLVTPSIAQNLVINGGFESDNKEMYSGTDVGTAPAGWTVKSVTPGNVGLAMIFAHGTIGRANKGVIAPAGAIVYEINVYGTNGSDGVGNGGLYTGTIASMESPSGDHFYGADGDDENGAEITQTIPNLLVGASYQLTFDWAAGQYVGAYGDYTSGWNITFGGQAASVSQSNIASHSFEPWKSETFTFTATSTSQVLSFLAAGTPSGVPPISLLDNVSLIQVPEASVSCIMGGCAIFALFRRRRKATL